MISSAYFDNFAHFPVICILIKLLSGLDGLPLFPRREPNERNLEYAR